MIFGNVALAENVPSQITIGYVDLVNSLLIAKQMHLPEKELGVPIKWVQFDSGAEMNTAMASGSIDFGSVGNPPAVVGIANGVPYKGIFILDVLGSVESLVARKNDNINGVKDLVGKKVGVPFGTTSHYELMNALKMDGINPSMVKIIDMSPPVILAAWKRGDIDAAYVWQPVLGEIAGSNGKVLLTSKQMAKSGYPTWDVAVVSKNFANKYPGLVRRYVKSLNQATSYWISQPGKSAELIAKELSQPVDDVTQMMDGTTMVDGKTQLRKEYLGTKGKKGKFVKNLHSTAAFLFEQKRIMAMPSNSAIESFIDPSYLESLF
jgi:taurine transport system substrate-binding protein